MHRWVLLLSGWLLTVTAIDNSIHKQHGQALTVTSSAGSHCSDLPGASRARQAHLHPAHTEDQISVVLLNWLRPANVVQILEAMVAYPEASLLDTQCGPIFPSLQLLHVAASDRLHQYKSSLKDPLHAPSSL